MVVREDDRDGIGRAFLVADLFASTPRLGLCRIDKIVSVTMWAKMCFGAAKQLCSGGVGERFNMRKRLRTRRATVLAGLLLSLAFTVHAQAYQTNVHGHVHPYTSWSPSDTLPGRTVHLWVQDWLLVKSDTGCDRCNKNGRRYFTTTSDQNGDYSIIVDTTPSYCSAPNTGKTNCELVVTPTGNKKLVCGLPCQDNSRNTEFFASTPGFEVAPRHLLIPPSTTPPNSVRLDIFNASHEMGVDGKYQARRLGYGSRPIFFIEGFDPGDTFRSEYFRAFLRKAILTSGSNVHDYLTSNGFSIWLLLTGPNGTESVWGRDAAGNITTTTGLAFSAMHLTKQIREKWHPGKEIVVGGYSGGGYVATVGLRNWCYGTFAAASQGLLQADCPEVALWFVGDTPLRPRFAGFEIPYSLLAYLKDPKIAAKLGIGTPDISLYLDTWGGREVMYGPQWKSCNTKCADGTCASHIVVQKDKCVAECPRESEYPCGCITAKWLSLERNKDFFDCEEDTHPYKRHDFDALPSREYVTRMVGGSRVPVPGISFSVGGSGKGPCRYVEGSKIVGMAEPFLEVWGPSVFPYHRLYPEGSDCYPGSLLSMLESVDKKHFLVQGFGTANVNTKLNYFTTGLATFPLYTRDTSDWIDYWYEDSNNPHTPVDIGAASFSLPPGASDFFVNWVWEYLHGKKSAPVCNNKAIQLGKRGTNACRQPVCGDGFCEGDLGGERPCDCVADCRQNVSCIDEVAPPSGGGSIGRAVPRGGNERYPELPRWFTPSETPEEIRTRSKVSRTAGIQTKKFRSGRRARLEDGDEPAASTSGSGGCSVARLIGTPSNSVVLFFLSAATWVTVRRRRSARGVP